MRVSLLFSIYLTLIPVCSKTINTSDLADDPSLENYFVTYVNGTKVVTQLSDIQKKFLK